MWTSLKAPSLAEMEAMAHDEFARLPKRFRALCEGVILRVDDFPTDEVLDEMDARANSICSACSRASACRSKAIRTSRGCRTWSGSTAARSSTTGPSTTRRSVDIVRHVLIHEIGHHFGLSDADMEAIEAGVGGGRQGVPAVSRTRCGILHAAPQSRDRYALLGVHEAPVLQRTASQGLRAALRPGHETTFTPWTSAAIGLQRAPQSGKPRSWKNSPRWRASPRP